MTSHPSETAIASVIAPATTVGPVALTVTDLARVRAFYETVLGLTATERAGGEVVLAAPGGPPLVRLHGDPGAPARDPHAPGLFHLAVLLPTRRDLAQALLRVAHARWPLHGASDHLVSEALYLSDPEGNGIELYRDRPWADWPHDASGTLQMDTLALDLDDLVAAAVAADGVAERLPTPEPHAPAGTHIGHVHLQVADIPRAEAFYHGVLGFEVVVRSYPGALFVSAGGYHHHLGLNTWNSAGAAPAAAGARGLSRFEIAVPDRSELGRVHERLQTAAVATATVDDERGALDLRDPFGNRLRVHAA